MDAPRLTPIAVNERTYEGEDRLCVQAFVGRAERAYVFVVEAELVTKWRELARRPPILKARQFLVSHGEPNIPDVEWLSREMQGASWEAVQERTVEAYARRGGFSSAPSALSTLRTTAYLVSERLVGGEWEYHFHRDGYSMVVVRSADVPAWAQKLQLGDRVEAFSPCGMFEDIEIAEHWDKKGQE